MAVIFNPFTATLTLVPTSSGGGGDVSGVGSANQLAYWSASSTITGDASFSIDAVNKLLKLSSGLDIAELTTLSSDSIVAGAATNQLLFTFPLAKNFCVIEYSAIRDTNYRMGTLLVANDGTNISVVDTYSEIGDTQLEFASPAVTHTINGSNVEIRYNSAGGSAGTFKKLMRRWA
jgi:hypothetical protein